VNFFGHTLGGLPRIVSENDFCASFFPIAIGPLISGTIRGPTTALHWVRESLPSRSSCSALTGAALFNDLMIWSGHPQSSGCSCIIIRLEPPVSEVVALSRDPLIEHIHSRWFFFQVALLFPSTFSVSKVSTPPPASYYNVFSRGTRSSSYPFSPTSGLSITFCRGLAPFSAFSAYLASTPTRFPPWPLHCRPGPDQHA